MSSMRLKTTLAWFGQKKEMIITFTSYFIYVVIMLYVCYYFAAKDMAEMQYLFGLPRYLSVLCIIAVIGAVCIMSLSHIVFKAEDLQSMMNLANNRRSTSWISLSHPLNASLLS